MSTPHCRIGDGVFREEGDDPKPDQLPSCLRLVDRLDLDRLDLDRLDLDRLDLDRLDLDRLDLDRLVEVLLVDML